jgi:hypothetical protein
MKQKDRVTVAQFDQALMEQISHVRSMNVNVIELASCTMYTLMVRKRLFGELKLARGPSEAIGRLMEDAKIARAQYEMQAQETAKRQERQERRIIVPGADPRSN